MKYFYLLVYLLAQGCASHAVRCEAHLLPINAAVPKAAATHGASE